MDKTLRNGLNMSETNPLNHKWLDFAIQSGLALHQFQLKLLLRAAIIQLWYFFKQSIPKLNTIPPLPNGWAKRIPCIPSKSVAFYLIQVQTPHQKYLQINLIAQRSLNGLSCPQSYTGQTCFSSLPDTILKKLKNDLVQYTYFHRYY